MRQLGSKENSGQYKLHDAHAILAADVYKARMSELVEINYKSLPTCKAVGQDGFRGDDRAPHDIFNLGFTARGPSLPKARVYSQKDQEKHQGRVATWIDAGKPAYLRVCSVDIASNYGVCFTTSLDMACLCPLPPPEGHGTAETYVYSFKIPKEGVAEVSSIQQAILNHPYDARHESHQQWLSADPELGPLNYPQDPISGKYDVWGALRQSASVKLYANEHVTHTIPPHIIMGAFKVRRIWKNHQDWKQGGTYTVEQYLCNPYREQLIQRSTMVYDADRSTEFAEMCGGTGKLPVTEK